MLITKDVISFAFVGDDNELDYVPLEEVDFIKEMENIVVESRPDHLVESEAKEPLALQIATIAEGYNSGRPYYIQLENNQSLQILKNLLLKNSKAARKRAEARTTFRRIQYAVRKVYDSQPFQIFVASLIAGVGGLSGSVRVRACAGARRSSAR